MGGSPMREWMGGPSCSHYFSIAVRKYHDQGNQRRADLGVGFQRVGLHDGRAEAAGGWNRRLEAYVLDHIRKQREWIKNGMSLETFKACLQ